MFKKFLMSLTLALVVLVGAASGYAADAPKPDSTGATIGTVADVVNATAGAPTQVDMDKYKASEPLASKLADVIGHNRISINYVWTLICGFLVMFMQLGFALAETGFTRAKNAGHTMGMNMMVYGIGMLGFWICGFGLQMGGCGGAAALGGGTLLNQEVSISIMGKSFGLFGTKGFFLGSDVYDVTVMTMFLFQMVFMDTTATIPTGAMAERWSFKSFVLYGFFISMFIYPLYANWVWGGGWLSQLGTNFGLGKGTMDFAGSSVVHMTGGVAALAGAICIGPRIGKYSKDGKPNAIPGHHIPMALAGCLVLAFGWFGFNAGSTLAGGDLRISIIATNTMLASAAGCMASMFYMWFRFGKPDVSMAGNGMLAGLVAITAPCAFVTPIASVIIGLIAGVLLCMSVLFVDGVLKIDDPVGAISVHGVNGAWGLISLGLFADGSYNGVTGLFYGDGGQFAAQLIGVCTNFVFVFVTMFLFFKISNKFAKLRVSAEVEQEGLDMAEVAVIGYPEFSITKTHR